MDSKRLMLRYKSSGTEAHYYTQGILNKIFDIFLMKNFGGQKAVGQQIQISESIKLSTKNTITGKAPIKSET